MARATSISSFSWRSECADGTRPVIDIPTAGIHTIDIWLREDGAKLDRILLTTDDSYNPAIDEPNESSYSPIYEIISDLDGDGDVDFGDFDFIGLYWLNGIAL